MQFWALRFEKDVEKLEKVQRQVTKVIKRLEDKLFEKSLTELGIFDLEKEEKRWLRGNVIAVFKYLKDCHKEWQG